MAHTQCDHHPLPQPYSETPELNDLDKPLRLHVPNEYEQARRHPGDADRLFCASATRLRANANYESALPGQD